MPHSELLALKGQKQYFVPKSLEPQSKEYDTCVTQCQKPIEDIRFELEF